MAKKKRISPYSMILLSFFFIILIGGTILSLPISTTDGQGTSWIDGIFTATSAVCVTGLVVNDVSRVYNLFGKTIIMIWIHHCGSHHHRLMVTIHYVYFVLTVMLHL